VRWSDYAFAEGGGLALLDRGLTCHEFTGNVRGERIEGTAQIVLPEGSRLELPWRASRKTSSEYFAPTGVDMP
jgi:hypothetical protein